MARETLQSLRTQLAQVRRSLDQALDYQRTLEKRMAIVGEIPEGSASRCDLAMFDIAVHVIPPSDLDAIERPTAGQIIQAAKEAKLRSNAIGEAAEYAAGQLELDCQHDDVVAVVDAMKKKIDAQSEEIEDLKNRLVDPDDVRDLISDIGLDTYPLTQFSVGDPMLALALKSH